MTSRRKRALLAVAIALVLGGALFAVWKIRSKPTPLPPPPKHADALDAVPADAGILATIDLAALRKSPLASVVTGARASAWLGGVRTTCGFEPLDTIDAIALTAPATEGDGDFGISGAGDIDQAKIVDCATKVIAQRGGRPVESALGSFKTVRDVSTTAPGAAGGIAARPGGPLLIGSGELLRSMVDTADGALPSVKTNSSHAALREAIAADSLAELSIVLSPKQRAAIAEEVNRTSGKAPNALKAVVAAALGVKVTTETVQIRAVVLVADDGQAKDLAAALDDLRKSRAASPILQRLGIGGLMGRVHVTSDGKEVLVHVEMTIEEAKDLVDPFLSGPDDKPPMTTPSATAPASP